MPCCASVMRHIFIEQSVLQLVGWLVGCFALLLGSYAVQNDLDWNKIIQGKADLKLGGIQTSARFRLNLTLQQQTVLMRNSKMEIVCLIGLSLFLLISIGVYTYVWIKDSQTKPNRASCVITIFHGLGSILLACLSISVLNGIVEISGRSKNICNGRYIKDLSSNNVVNSKFLKFIRDTSCMCSNLQKSAEFNNVTYNLESLKDFGICQSSSLKQIAGISLFVYTTIAIALACTQLKDLIVMKSSAAFHSSPYQDRSKPVGYQFRQSRAGNSKGDYCTCSSNNSTKMNIPLKRDPQSRENNNYVDLNQNPVIYGQTHSTVANVEDHRTDTSLFGEHSLETIAEQSPSLPVTIL